MLDTSFGELIKRIKDELLLWLLGMLVLAIVAGLRDRVTFIAVLVVGAALIALRLVLERRHHGLPLAISFVGTESGDVLVEKCEFELRDRENKLKGGGEMAISFDVYGWVCFYHGTWKPRI